jgi:hypothetical protein
MPITKQQDQVPGVSEEVANLQARIDQLEKENRELREASQGNIVQASSAPLHNYPDAEVKMREQDPAQQGTPQPRTGASAVAKEE